MVPLETERTAGVASRLRAAQVDRLRRLSLEVLKQCGSAWATEVADPVSLAGLIAGARDGVRWLAEAGGSPPPAELDAGPVTVVVGPEGGLTADEVHGLAGAGALVASLGPRLLRTETAGAVAVALLQARYGDLGRG